MRRADRLFQIIQYLRGRRLTTARWLAERLEVSERTIYRDICDLTLSGVPIEGEAGVGYVLRRGFDLPPLMFDRDEIEALVVGARMVGAWSGTRLASMAERALSKIKVALPAHLQQEIHRSRLFVPEMHIPTALAAYLDQIRFAINARQVIRFGYRREDGEISARDARPLGLFFWGSVWTLGAWCELRQAFRNFRVDRMSDLECLEQIFVETSGLSLTDFLRSVYQESGVRQKRGKAAQPSEF